jgi:hypothetical protein
VLSEDTVAFEEWSPLPCFGNTSVDVVIAPLLAVADKRRGIRTDYCRDVPGGKDGIYLSLADAFVLPVRIGHMLYELLY